MPLSDAVMFAVLIGLHVTGWLLGIAAAAVVVRHRWRRRAPDLHDGPPASRNDAAPPRRSFAASWYPDPDPAKALCPVLLERVNIGRVLLPDGHLEVLIYAEPDQSDGATASLVRDAATTVPDDD